MITPPTITPLLVAELLVEGERWPVYVHVIDHPAARVLVDTGMTELRPEVADLDPRLVPLSEQAFDLAGVDIVVNTHLHFDHCGGNHLFAADDDRTPDSSRRRATRAACRWSSSRRAGVRSSSAATWPFASASSTSLAPRASFGYARSSPSSSGSRTSTSPGGRTPCKARRRACGPR